MLNGRGQAAIAASFIGGGLTRAAHLREDAAGLAAALADPSARILAVWRGRPLIARGPEGARLGWLPAGHPILGDASGMPIFLGLLDFGPVFAVNLDRFAPEDLDAAALGSGFDLSEQPHPAAPRDHAFAELRAIMSALSDAEAEAAATARALIGWHESHGFCARCGALSEARAAGWQRLCPACGAHHFPRTDPVVIMLVTRADRLLLARSHGWPQGMYSAPAGFVEPGETLEAAVRREVHEETGLRIGQVGYVASQPWPFPASLMFGCTAEALDDEIVVDRTELEDAIWMRRDEVAAMAAGRLPGRWAARPGSIAHGLIRAWLEGRI